MLHLKYTGGVLLFIWRNLDQSWFLWWFLGFWFCIIEACGSYFEFHFVLEAGKEEWRLIEINLFPVSIVCWQGEIAMERAAAQLILVQINSFSDFFFFRKCPFYLFFIYVEQHFWDKWIWRSSQKSDNKEKQQIINDRHGNNIEKHPWSENRIREQHIICFLYFWLKCVLEDRQLSQKYDRWDALTRWLRVRISSVFSCPEQLNRWPCHSLTDWLTHWLTHWATFDFWH